MIQELGVIQGVHCPHYNDHEIAKKFDKHILMSNHTGIAIEENCAIEFNEGLFRIIKSDSNAKAYKLVVKEDELQKTELTNITEYLPLEFLYR
ncbi:type 1 glutamine amidotransferase family protein [Litchfieldia alkalitelluris]|uniref:hypothetical protein n=1 Tax=Litchfieldia alkalitelluris TaxID=304268 RepID=UPI0009971CE3|nr:hypothetical protein [Litchfieldia alkalitelluris]